ncbi:MAG: hypothetical protein AABZ12_07700, partial [Planctomycetota bacterium]
SRYPAAEPDCRTLHNDVLRQLSTMRELDQLERDTRFYRYDQDAMSRWKKDIYYEPCAARPIVRHGGDAGGEPWTVLVRVYGEDCAWPADLVIARVTYDLTLDIDRADLGVPPSPYETHSRLAAQFHAYVELSVRLRAGWEQIPCRLRLNAGNPCDPILENPFLETLDKYLVTTADGCTIVPRKIEWRGMRGPRPWSKGSFAYQPVPVGAELCCDFLKELHGLVIPGECNDFAGEKPWERTQRWDGAVAIGLISPPSVAGCA